AGLARRPRRARGQPRLLPQPARRAHRPGGGPGPGALRPEPHPQPARGTIVRHGQPVEGGGGVTTELDAPTAPASGRRLKLWHEVVLILAFYGIYSFIRNQFGSAGSPVASTREAYDNAKDIIDVQRTVGLFH